MLPAQRVVAEGRMAAQWRKLNCAHWQAASIAAVTAVHANAAWGLAGAEDARLPQIGNAAGLDLLQRSGWVMLQAAVFCCPTKLSRNMGWAPATAAAWTRHLDRPQRVLQAAITCTWAACSGQSICCRLP